MTAVLPGGVVAALHRYPFESMQGEQVTELSLTVRGAMGGRALALLDRRSGLVASAHHTGKRAKLLQHSARHQRTGAADETLATLPDDQELAASAELDERLTALLGRKAHFWVPIGNEKCRRCRRGLPVRAFWDSRAGQAPPSHILFASTSAATRSQAKQRRPMDASG